MSNRFKFRVWSVTNKEYIIAYLYIAQSGICLEIDEFQEEHDIGEHIIEQCTGLHDKNGKLIYEGDVVKTVTGDIGIVQWIPARAGFLVYFPDNSCCLVHETQEIIGNKHEQEQKQ